MRFSAVIFDFDGTLCDTGPGIPPDRWAEIGLVPDHMTPDDFEMFVYEWLEDYLAEHKDEIEAERAAERAKAAASTFPPWSRMARALRTPNSVSSVLFPSGRSRVTSP